MAQLEWTENSGGFRVDVVVPGRGTTPLCQISCKSLYAYSVKGEALYNKNPFEDCTVHSCVGPLRVDLLRQILAKLEEWCQEK